MALANAGELVGLVLAQLKRQGAPVILSGGYNDVFDMRTMRALYQAPENHHGRAEFAHYYGLPVFGLAGASDAKILDQQAAAEAAFSLLFEALRGVNLVHDLGYLEGGNCYSLEYLVVCDELVAYVKRLMQGLEVSEESLALDVIHEVGHQGDFLNTKHTRDHFRENWYPKLFDRNNFEDWTAGGSTSMCKRSNEQIGVILGGYEPQPLPPDVQGKIDRVVERAGV
jgi:trimethylamine--corrinoid protein Co-methyltransferase